MKKIDLGPKEHSSKTRYGAFPEEKFRKRGFNYWRHRRLPPYSQRVTIKPTLTFRDDEIPRINKLLNKIHKSLAELCEELIRFKLKQHKIVTKQS